MKKLMIGVLVLCMAVMMTACGNNQTFEDEIIQEGKESIEEDVFSMNNPYKEDNWTMEVRKKEKQFEITINGEKLLVELYEEKESELEVNPTSVSKLTQISKDILDSSKKLVNKFIESSNVLEDKEELIQYIDEINVKEATFDLPNVGACYDPNNDRILVNSENSDCFCEWMLVHELFHALSHKTHQLEGKEQEFITSMFDETITDILTASLNPEITEGIISGYSKYGKLVYRYIGIMEEEAIKAYFYGYEPIYAKLDKEELEFFVKIIDCYGEDLSDLFYNNLVAKWLANTEKG